MIGYLNGSVAWIDDDVCIIDVGGVGYQVYCTRLSLEQLKYYRGKAEQVKLYTRLIHREDVFDLYGFLSRDEYELFNMLIKVSGIGPRQGLKILGIDSPERIIGAIASGDEAFLTSLPGIGSKKARQIIIPVYRVSLSTPMKSLPISIRDLVMQKGQPSEPITGHEPGLSL